MESPFTHTASVLSTQFSNAASVQKFKKLIHCRVDGRKSCPQKEPLTFVFNPKKRFQTFDFLRVKIISSLTDHVLLLFSCTCFWQNFLPAKHQHIILKQLNIGVTRHHHDYILYTDTKLKSNQIIMDLLRYSEGTKSGSSLNV